MLGSTSLPADMCCSEALLDLVLASSAYTNSTQTRTYNDEDSILAEENSEGNNAYLDYELVGSSIEEGVLYAVLLLLPRQKLTRTNAVATSQSASTSPTRLRSARPIMRPTSSRSTWSRL